MSSRGAIAYSDLRKVHLPQQSLEARVGAVRVEEQQRLNREEEEPFALPVGLVERFKHCVDFPGGCAKDRSPVGHGRAGRGVSAPIPGHARDRQTVPSGPTLGLGVDRPRARKILDPIAKGLVDGNLPCRTAPPDRDDGC
jgi:hypothetical protein